MFRIKNKQDYEALTPRKKLIFLFFTTFMLSAFTLGGGPVIVALLRQKLVDKLGIFTQEEILDLLSVAQSAPGPIAVNVSVLMAYQLLSWKGALVSLFGTILPPFILLSLIYPFYFLLKENLILRYILQGFRIAILVELAYALYKLFYDFLKQKEILMFLLFPLLVFLFYVLKLPIYILLILSAVVGFVFSLALERNKR